MALQGTNSVKVNIAAALLAAAFALVGALPSAVGLAHHSYVTKYDPARTVRYRGIIRRVQFRNPHIFFDLETPNGTITVETESIQIVNRRGLTAKILAEGRTATVAGWAARSGSGEVGLQSITIEGAGTFTIRRTPR